MYSIKYEHRVEKDLEPLPKNIIKRALDTIETILKYNPFVGKKLEYRGRHLYRYRIGDYRIVYRVDKKEKDVVVLKIRHRKEVYRGM